MIPERMVVLVGYKLNNTGLDRIEPFYGTPFKGDIASDVDMAAWRTARWADPAPAAPASDVAVDKVRALSSYVGVCVCVCVWMHVFIVVSACLVPAYVISASLRSCISYVLILLSQRLQIKLPTPNLFIPKTIQIKENIGLFKRAGFPVIIKDVVDHNSSSQGSVRIWYKQDVLHQSPYVVLLTKFWSKYVLCACDVGLLDHRSLMC